MRGNTWRKNVSRKLDPNATWRYTAEMLERDLKSGKIKHPPLEYKIMDPTRDHTKENKEENRECQDEKVMVKSIQK